MHALGTEGIAGDRENQRRIHATGEPENNAREAVFANIIASTADECLVHALFFRQ